MSPSEGSDETDIVRADGGLVLELFVRCYPVCGIAFRLGTTRRLFLVFASSVVYVNSMCNLVSVQSKDACSGR